jgi:hypothetical protein
MTDQLKEQNQERRRFWKSHIEGWSLSGLSQTKYCRQNNLRSNRFTYWKRKFERENLPVEFVQIHTEPVKSVQLFRQEETSLRLAVGTGFTIEIPNGFSPGTLKQLLFTLKEV